MTSSGDPFRDEEAVEPVGPSEVTDPADADVSAGPVGEDTLPPDPAGVDPVEQLLDEDVPGDDQLVLAQMALAERTADLQRLQAEFLNYKRRVDRDRELVKQNATYAVLTPMLDVLDNIDRARQAGEVEGGFKGVADQLDRIVTNLGLTRFGEPGDAFDPNLHEALSHVGSSPEVQVVTAQHIAKAGYRIGERVVRPAQVLVVDPEPGS